MLTSRKKWQKEFIRLIFDSKMKDYRFSDIILDNFELINSKSKYLPDFLYKYYAPTSENILDIKNKRLWVAHPNTFNDPYDCRIGYNEDEYEKKQLLEAIIKNNLLGVSGDNVITEDEYDEICNSLITDEHYSYSAKKKYYFALYNILKNKTKFLQEEIYKLRHIINENAKQKMNDLRNTNVRIACFAAEKSNSKYYANSKNDEYLSKIQMWSHYASNHKGFCVQYDMSSIKKDITLDFSPIDFYNADKENYLAERLSAVIKGGLFPVIYTKQRVKIPYTKLKKYKADNYSAIIDTLFKAYITKSTVWSYENEWRLIVDDKVSDYYKNKIPFPYVKRIYLGCNMEKHHIDELVNIAHEIGAKALLMKMQSDKFDLSDISSEDNMDEIMRVLYSPYTR